MTTNGLLGTFPDMPNEDYHRDLAVGSSGLKRFSVSPLHYWAACIDPDRESTDKKHFRIGRAWHCAVFEGQEFDARFAVNHDLNPLTNLAKLLAECLGNDDLFGSLRGVPDDIKLSTKEGKALAATFEAQGLAAVPQSDLDFITEWRPKLQGRDILSADSIKAVHKMAAIARDLPVSRVVFDQLGHVGAAEQSMFGVDPATGVRLKIRPDYCLVPCKMFPNGLIIDGKTTTDASPTGFGRQVWNLDYGLQAAFYPRVFQQLLGTKGRPAFLWLAQEKDAPHAAAYYSAGADLMAYWDKRIDAMLPQIAACQERGEWPGYTGLVTELALPTWAEKQVHEGGAA